MLKCHFNISMKIHETVTLFVPGKFICFIKITQKQPQNWCVNYNPYKHTNQLKNILNKIISIET